MEPTLAVQSREPQAKPSETKDAGKINPEIKAGDVAIMGEGYPNSCKVKVLSIGWYGYGASVQEVETGRKWSINASLLSI